MDNLSSLEFKQLEALLSGKTLTTGEQIKALTILRDNFPDFLSSPILNLTEANRKDNIFLIKFFRDSFNRNKIKAAARQIISKSLSTVQKQELEKSLVSPVTPTETSEPTAEQSGATEATPVEQVPPPRATTDTAGGEIPGMGIPSPTISVAPRIRDIHEVPQTTPPSGMEGGTGQGSATFSKGGRLDTQRVGAATAKGNILEMQTAIQKEMQTVQSASQKPAEAFETRPSGLKFNPSAFKARIGNIFKKIQDFAARANPFLKTNLNRIFQGFKSFGGSLLGGLGGFSRGITGPGLTHTANFLGNTGLRGVNAGANFFGGTRNQFLRFREASNRAASFTKSVKDKKWLLFLLGLMFLTGFTAITSTDQTGTTGGTTILSSDINQCRFTRSGDAVKELTYKSPLLLSYIQEASSLTNIPAAVLAAFIRVETSSTVTKNDEEIKALSSVDACPTSTTGALGVMQIQPKGTKGHDNPAVENGAKLIGKKYEDLTKEDYCDVKKSIIMGAGFILKKMTYKTDGYPKTYGDGTKWDASWTNDKQAIDKLVSGYYGCLRYGSPDDNNISCTDSRRIYNYGDDVWTSIQSCKTQTPPPGQPPTKEFALSCPIANENNTCSHFDDPRDACHCNPDPKVYISQQACKDSPPLKYGIDVGTKASQTAVIPFITYQGESTPQAMACQLFRAQGATCPATGCENQQILHFHCSTAKGTPDLYLQYNHIKANPNYEKSIGTTLLSGQSVGDVAYYQTGLRRLNIQLGVDGECSFGEENVKFCKRGGDYFQCPLKKDSNPD